MGVHYHTVLGVLFKPFNVGHEVGGKLACRAAAVGKAPKHRNAFSVGIYPDYTEIVFGIVQYILKILSRPGNGEYHPR